MPASQTSSWRGWQTFESSPNFDRLEKAVLRYAEEMSRTPAYVSDEAFAGVRSFLSDEQLVELTGDRLGEPSCAIQLCIQVGKRRLVRPAG